MTLAEGDMSQYDLLKTSSMQDYLNKLDHFIPEPPSKTVLTAPKNIKTKPQGKPKNKNKKPPKT
jgi:hypothetical protein